MARKPDDDAGRYDRSRDGQTRQLQAGPSEHDDSSYRGSVGPGRDPDDVRACQRVAQQGLEQCSDKAKCSATEKSGNGAWETEVTDDEGCRADLPAESVDDL